jgi:hypothetical protein
MANGRKILVRRKQFEYALYNQNRISYKLRLKLVLGPNCPELACYSDLLSIGGYKARFMHIKAASADADRLIRLLDSKKGNMTEQFIPWKAWSSVVEGRKAKAVETQENLQINIDSVQDRGYNDNKKIVMGNSRAIELLQQQINEEIKTSQTRRTK